jgi:hypothetical protein
LAIQTISKYYIVDLVLQETPQELREDKKDTSDRLQFSENVRIRTSLVEHYHLNFVVLVIDP